MSWPVMVFDIESIPDIAGLRALGLAQGDDDAQAYAAWLAQRAAEGKSDFAPLHLQRVLVISCVFRNAEGLRIHSFVDREIEGQSQEGKIIQTFLQSGNGLVIIVAGDGGRRVDLVGKSGLTHGQGLDGFA